MDVPLSETISIVTAIGAFAGWIYQWRESRVEKKHRKTAEAELELIRRRGNAPYLIPSSKRFDRLYHSLSQREVKFWEARKDNVLCYCRDEVGKELPKGTLVILAVDNAGEYARRVKVTLDGEPASLKREVDFGDAGDNQFLEYSFDPGKRGVEQKLTVFFETSDGFQDVHIYRTKHGFRELFRIDPV